MSTGFNTSYVYVGYKWFDGTHVRKFEPQPGMVYLDDASGAFEGKDLAPCLEQNDISATFVAKDVAPCLELNDYEDNLVLEDIIPQELYGADPSY